MGDLFDITGFTGGKLVEAEKNFEGVLETPKFSSVKRLVLPFSESTLLKDMTPQRAHADILANPLLVGDSGV